MGFEKSVGITLNRYTVTDETLDSLFEIWRDPAVLVRWKPIFVLPPWLKAWWSSFGRGHRLSVSAVWEGAELIGIAPCIVDGATVRFLGSSDVCDYLDVITVPGKERQFFVALVGYLRRQGLRHLLLDSLRPDSVTATHFSWVIKATNGTIRCEEEDVALGIELPAVWGDYLARLTGKQRHEVRRKLRRLHEAGRVRFRSVSDARFANDAIETFLGLFAASRSDKARFMTDSMAGFFCSLAEEMASANLLRFFFLDLNEVPVAAVMCFDYGTTRYLYNSGYDKRYQSLSVGLLCKVLSIKDSIERNHRRYDFLRGAEGYKSRLGGRPIALYRCRVDLSA